MTALYHGGAPGLAVGARIVPGHQRRFHEGCAACAANARGEHHPLSPATPTGWVYACADRLYAKYYASLYSLGWLYRVEFDGPSEASAEDCALFGTRRGTALVVVAVVDRAVRLTMSERRRLFVRWGGTRAELDALVGLMRWSAR